MYNILYKVAAAAFTDVLREFKSNNGSIEKSLDKMMPLAETARLMGLDEINELEKKFNLKVSGI